MVAQAFKLGVIAYLSTDTGEGVLLRELRPPVLILAICQRGEDGSRSKWLNAFVTKIRHEASGFMILPCEKDEWEAWREHPITQWLFDGFLKNEAEAAKQEFIDYAWGRAGNDPVKHAAMFERNKVIIELINLNYDDIEAHYSTAE